MDMCRLVIATHRLRGVTFDSELLSRCELAAVAAYSDTRR